MPKNTLDSSLTSGGRKAFHDTARLNQGGGRRVSNQHEPVATSDVRVVTSKGRPVNKLS